MYYSGFADEASPDLARQISATKALGWKNIESRNIGKLNIHDIPDEEFDKACEMLADAGVSINCFGSTVANWACHVFVEEEYQKTLECLKRALVRMKKLDCKLLRGMSFRAEWSRPRFDPEVEKLVFSRLEYMVKMCEDAGVLYLHENCNNYGGQSWQHTLRLLDRIKSPAFKILFDTCNPVMNYDRSEGDELVKMQNTWDFYRNVREFIYYVHIKDGILVEPNPDGFGKTTYTFAGEGQGYVREVVTDLLKHGYDGCFSMEPHMRHVFHNDNPDEKAELCYTNYIEYGQKFMKLVDEVKAGLAK